jgi:hypothetical protein
MDATLEDVRDELLNGSLSEEVEAKNKPDAPATGSPDGESRPVEDKPVVASGAEAKPDDKPAEKPAEVSAEASKKEPEQPLIDDDPEVDLGNGKKMRRSEILSEMDTSRADRLRHDAYTRQRQEDARKVKEAEGRANSRTELTAKIVRDPSLKEMVKTYPEVLEHLLAEPASTAALLNNPTAVEQFWEDYEVLQKHPHLAERLSSRGSEVSPEDQAVLDRAKTGERVNWIAAELNNAVDHFAKQYPDEDANEVRHYVLSLGGIHEKSTPAEVIEGFGNLQRLFFKNTNEGVRIDGKFIVDRFDSQKTIRTLRTTRTTADADKHNAEVDAALKQELEVSPATPTGASPAAAAPKQKQHDDLASILEDLQDGGPLE